VLLGALLGWQLLGGRLGPEGPKLAAALCASYIGGAVNFAAVAKVRQGGGARRVRLRQSHGRACSAHLRVVQEGTSLTADRPRRLLLPAGYRPQRGSPAPGPGCR
jgi:hypothetical protein